MIFCDSAASNQRMCTYKLFSFHHKKPQGFSIIMGPLTCFHSKCITVNYLHYAVSNCQRIRISGELPSRLKKFYCISLTALPIFLDNSLYCLSSGRDDIFFRTYVMQQSLLVTGIPLHLPQVISRMIQKKQPTQAKPITTLQRKVMYKETAFGRKLRQK